MRRDARPRRGGGSRGGGYRGGSRVYVSSGGGAELETWQIVLIVIGIVALTIFFYLCKYGCRKSPDAVNNQEPQATSPDMTNAMNMNANMIHNVLSK